MDTDAPATQLHPVEDDVVRLGANLVRRLGDAGQRAVWRFSLEGALEGRLDGSEGGLKPFVCPSPYLALAARPDGGG